MIRGCIGGKNTWNNTIPPTVKSTKTLTDKEVWRFESLLKKIKQKIRQITLQTHPSQVRLSHRSRTVQAQTNTPQYRSVLNRCQNYWGYFYYVSSILVSNQISPKTSENFATKLFTLIKIRYTIKLKSNWLRLTTSVLGATFIPCLIARIVLNRLSSWTDSKLLLSSSITFSSVWLDILFAVVVNVAFLFDVSPSTSLVFHLYSR